MTPLRHHRPKAFSPAGFLRRTLVCVLFFTLTSPLYGQTIDISGQFSSWGQVDPDAPSHTQTGARYIPEFSFCHPLSGTWELAVEAALNLYGFEIPEGKNDEEFNADLYRLWVRLASPRLEIRGGLQKISFGSAILLRPLMWFDSTDPRDPLGLTRGVYGILGRYYFQDNRNLWIWGLYGNDRLRGWQTVPGDKNEPEYGCRFQVPFGPGEIAFSYHHRKAEPSGTAFGKDFPTQGEFAEDAFGVDGKWDFAIGMWFEGTLTRRDLDVPEPRYIRMITVGADYTFEIGNGLHVLGEHLVIEKSDEAFGSGNSVSFSAIEADYPVNFFDSLSAILYYDHQNDTLSSFLQWQRTYDAWQVYLSFFHNPDRPSSLTAADGGYTEISGDGVRLMFVYNH